MQHTQIVYTFSRTDVQHRVSMHVNIWLCACEYVCLLCVREVRGCPKWWLTTEHELHITTNFDLFLYRGASLQFKKPISASKEIWDHWSSFRITPKRYKMIWINTYIHWCIFCPANCEESKFQKEKNRRQYRFSTCSYLLTT